MAEPRVGDMFGRYRVERPIGAGGMGNVYAALDTNLDRVVALKVVLAHLAESESFRERFHREASTLARIESSHIIRIYDHGEQDGSPYITTQYVAGGDLSDLFRKRGALRPAVAAEICAQIAEALADAHDAGVIHRDVKASNVLIKDPDASRPFAYLCDFGIAQTDAAGLTNTGAVAGTWAYLAPERANGAPASPSSDIYSLGCLFFASLTGRAPYSGSDVEVAMAHLNRPVPQLPGNDPLTYRVNQILAVSMAKDPAHRYPSAAEFGRALRALAQSPEAITATGAAGAPAGAPYHPSHPSQASQPSQPSQPSSPSNASMPLAAGAAGAGWGAGAGSEAATAWGTPGGGPPGSGSGFNQPYGGGPSGPFPSYGGPSGPGGPGGPTGPGGPGSSKGGGGLKLPLLIGGLVLVLIAGIAGIALLISRGGDEEPTTDPTASGVTGGTETGGTGSTEATGGVTPVAGEFEAGGGSDFNGDGKGDFSLHVYGADPDASIYLPSNGKAFGAQRGLVQDLYSPLTGDVDGDGTQEAIYANDESNGKYTMSYTKDGKAVSSTVPAVLGGQPLFSFAGDFNGDGKTDIGIPSYYDSAPFKIWVALSNGSGFAKPVLWMNIPGKPQNAIPGDFDGDGRDDLWFDGYGNSYDTMTYYKSTGSAFEIGSTSDVDSVPIYKTVADVDGDGQDEIVSSSGYGNDELTVFKLNGDTFETKVWYSGSATSISDDSYLESGDYDGDGHEDIARIGKRMEDKTTIEVYRSNGSALSKPTKWGTWNCSCDGSWQLLQEITR